MDPLTRSYCCGDQHVPSEYNAGVIARKIIGSTAIGEQNNYHYHYHFPTQGQGGSSPQPKKASTLPSWENPKFYGRSHDLDNLHAKLCGHDRTPPMAESRLRSCLVHGVAGVGKTQLALKYALSYRDCYSYVLWIDCETEPKMIQDAMTICGILRLKIPRKASNRAIMDAVRFWLEEKETKWLLIFDNVESFKSLNPHLPRSRHGSVLLTSQCSELKCHTVHNIPLMPFSEDEGRACLLAYLEKPNDAAESRDVLKLCRELGGLPIAIAHFAGFIIESQVEVKVVLEMLTRPDEASEIFNKKPETTSEYKKPLNVVWDIALNELDRDALSLLRILSMMSADGVPEEMFQKEHSSPALRFLKDMKRMRYLNIITSLCRRQLVSKSNIHGIPCLLTHRPLQRSILYRLQSKGDGLQEAFEMSVALLRDAFLYPSSTPNDRHWWWEAWKKYTPHVLSIWQVYKEWRDNLSPSMELAGLLWDAVDHFLWRGMFDEGIMVCDTVEEILDASAKNLPKQQADVLTLGAALHSYGGILAHPGSFVRFLKSLYLRQQHLNNLDPANVTEDDIDKYADAWTNLGSILANYKLYEEAIPCYDLAMGVRRRMGQGVNMNVQSQALKSFSLAGLGRFDEAKRIFRRPHPTIANARIGMIERAGKTLKSPSGHLEIQVKKIDFFYLTPIIEEIRGNKRTAPFLPQMSLEDAEARPSKARLLGEHYLRSFLAMMDIEDDAGMKAEAVPNDPVWRCSTCGHSVSLNYVKADDKVIYDHMLPVEFGASASDAISQMSARKINNICRRILKTVETALPGGEVVPLHELVQHLKYPEDLYPTD